MPHYNFIQTGFVVNDIDQAVADWRATTDLGPFFLMLNVRPQNGFYRGRAGELEMHIAFVQAGPMQIELIQPLSRGPSIYRDTYPVGTPGGPHHLCCFVEDFEAEDAHLRDQGIATGYRAEFGDLRFGYYDTRATLGCFTELLSSDRATMDMFQSIADAAVDWDGSNPIRYIGT